LNAILDVCSKRGDKHEMGAGHHCPPAGDGPGSTLVFSQFIHQRNAMPMKRIQETL